MSVSIIAAIRERKAELSRFAVVGLAGVVVDAAVFNALRLGPLAPEVEVAGNTDRVVTAKVIATIVSILFAWIAHRMWTFKQRKNHRALYELLLFGAINGAALAIQGGVLAISHHGLGWTSVLADNLVAYGIGLPLGTIARYVGYRKFVFSKDDEDQPAPTPVA